MSGREGPGPDGAPFGTWRVGDEELVARWRPVLGPERGGQLDVGKQAAVRQLRVHGGDHQACILLNV